MKKMKILKKVFSLVLVMVLSFMVIPQEAYAMENAEGLGLISPLYIDIDSFEVAFDVLSDGRMLFYSYVVSASADQINISAYLQKYVNGGWSIVESFYNTSYEFSCIVDGDMYVSRGTYRITANCYTYKNGRLTDTDTIVSRSKTY